MFSLPTAACASATVDLSVSKPVTILHELGNGVWWWTINAGACHSNFGPILRHFRDIAGFCAHDPTLFHHNFGVVPVGPDCRCCIGVS